MRKGHFARALDKQQAAIAAAKALGNSPDCLITAALQLEKVRCSVLYAQFLKRQIPRSDADADCSPAIDLLFITMEALGRRKAAGTLLPGSCRTLEVEWNALRHRSAIEEFSSDSAFRDRFVSDGAPLIGYEAYLIAAAVAATFIVGSAAPVSASEIDSSIVQLLEFVTSAVNLMALPRRDDVTVTDEVAFIKIVSHYFETTRLPDHPAAQQLLEAWTQLHSSGVMLARATDRTVVEETLRHNSAFAERQAAALAAETRLTCVLPSCGAREAHAAQFKKCAACKGAAYCCHEHHVAHWPAHKAACKAARKPAGAEKTAASS